MVPMLDILKKSHSNKPTIVLLVGGGSRMPYVKHIIQEALKDKDCAFCTSLEAYCEETIVRGCAIKADLLYQLDSIFKFDVVETKSSEAKTPDPTSLVSHPKELPLSLPKPTHKKNRDYSSIHDQLKNNEEKTTYETEKKDEELITDDELETNEDLNNVLDTKSSLTTLSVKSQSSSVEEIDYIDSEKTTTECHGNGIHDKEIFEQAIIQNNIEVEEQHQLKRLESFKTDFEEVQDFEVNRRDETLVVSQQRSENQSISTAYEMDHQDKNENSLISPDVRPRVIPNEEVKLGIIVEENFVKKKINEYTNQSTSLDETFKKDIKTAGKTPIKRPDESMLTENLFPLIGSEANSRNFHLDNFIDTRFIKQDLTEHNQPLGNNYENLEEICEKTPQKIPVKKSSSNTITTSPSSYDESYSTKNNREQPVRFKNESFRYQVEVTLRLNNQNVTHSTPPAIPSQMHGRLYEDQTSFYGNKNDLKHMREDQVAWQNNRDAWRTNSGIHLTPEKKAKDGFLIKPPHAQSSSLNHHAMHEHREPPPKVHNRHESRVKQETQFPQKIYIETRRSPKEEPLFDISSQRPIINIDVDQVESIRNMKDRINTWREQVIAYK
uniref:Uncharacterized protein n=1 Tax=Acrobeloides nanus TaxID=290746 RepID=A0A914CKR7_9BILA